MRLNGKRAVITGGSNGIGRASAERFAREGASVVIADRDRVGGESTARAISETGAKAAFIEADVTDRASTEAMIAKADTFLGGIDVFLSNAGTCFTEDLLEIEPEAWGAELDLNLTGHYLASRAALPIMIRGGGGSFVYVSSVNGLWAIGEFGYSAAKAALISFAKNMAVTYGSKGVRANVVCPGTIATETGGAYWDQKVGSRKRLLKWYPVGRLGKPEDVASLALYLASDESSFMTGATLVIDGGLTAGTRLFGNV